MSRTCPEGVPGGSGGGSGGGAEDAAEAGGGGAGSVLTAAHVSFFLRFGYVVVEGAVPEELTAAIATDVREHLLRRHGIDLDDAVRTLTLPRLQRAFSPDGSGMLEVYWLRSMEEVRQLPALHDVTRTLFERSWGAAARGFRRSRSSGMVAQPDLGLYIDRTSVRLPAAALQPLLRRDGPVASASAASTGFKIRVPTGGAATNGGGRGRDGGGRGRGGDVYSVKAPPRRCPSPLLRLASALPAAPRVRPADAARPHISPYLPTSPDISRRCCSATVTGRAAARSTWCRGKATRGRTRGSRPSTFSTKADRAA